MAWKYSDKVKDHYLHPRNVGELNSANAVGEVGSMVCGDALKLFLKVDPDTEKIEDVSFQTYGCGSAIASSSALTEIIRGMTLEQALHVSNKDLADYLDGLPEEKMHCSVMGKEALEAAVASYRGEEYVHDDEDEGKIICHCFGVTDKQIEKVVIENNLDTVEQVTNYTKAGGACGSCLHQIEEIITSVRSKHFPETAPQLDTRGSTSPELKKKVSLYKKIKIIEDILDKEVRPALGMDSGGLDLVDVEDDTIYVRLIGKCHGCVNSEVTVEFIREQIEQILGEKINVVNVE
ncbi:MAG: Fe-S cluster assembly protein NifU [Deltaproteobacteria bacterium]|nr:Fe-S cluster assembly protein NifU [Deltaproteobacteria bacterium]